MGLIVDIKKDFGDFKLEAAFEAGSEILGLLGASGCGKSMTLKCIAGIVKPDKGQIILDGETLFDSQKKINLPPQQRHVGLLFQNYGLFPNMTVEQNIKAGLRRWQKDKKAGAAAVKHIIEKLYLKGLEGRRPHELSGGQQQRTALARILVSKPKIIMLDEPLSALDTHLRWEVEAEIMNLLNVFGKTAILVSHDRDEIYRICDRVCVMDQGCTQPATTMKDLFFHPRTMAAAKLSGCKNISAVRQLDEHRLLATDWGIAFHTRESLSPWIKGIGLRAKYISWTADPSRGCGENQFLCKIVRRLEEPFFHIYLLAPIKEDGDLPQKLIRLDLDKHLPQIPDDIHEVIIGIDKENLLLLS